MYKLTVAIPTYNRAILLRESIISVLAQTYKNFQINIIDNGSTDNTYSIVNKINNPIIKYFKNDFNIGPIGNLNKSIEVCDTEYLVIFHDDDIMKQDMLSKLIQVMERDKSIVIVGSNMDLMDDNKVLLNRKFLQIKEDILYNKFEYIESFYKDGIVLPCPSVMFRKKFLEENNIKFRENVGPSADAYLWNEINTYNNKIYLIAESLMNYRYHESESDIQKNNAIGKNYIHQIALHKNSYDLAVKHKLNKIIPLILKQRDHYFNLLIEDFMTSKLNHEDFLKEINSEPFYNISISLTLKIKLFFIKKLPVLIIKFEKLKSILRKILK